MEKDAGELILYSRYLLLKDRIKRKFFIAGVRDEEFFNDYDRVDELEEYTDELQKELDRFRRELFIRKTTLYIKDHCKEED